MVIRVLVATLAAFIIAACGQMPDRLPASTEILAADGTPVPVSMLLGRPLVLVFYRHYG